MYFFTQAGTQIGEYNLNPTHMHFPSLSHLLMCLSPFLLFCHHSPISLLPLSLTSYLLSHPVLPPTCLSVSPSCSVHFSVCSLQGVHVCAQVCEFVCVCQSVCSPAAVSCLLPGYYGNKTIWPLSGLEQFLQSWGFFSPSVCVCVCVFVSQ